MIIRIEQKKTLARLLPDEYERFIEKDDVAVILDALDDLYLELLDDEQEPTPESRECERLRDSLHFGNYHNKDIEAKEN